MQEGEYYSDYTGPKVGKFTVYKNYDEEPDSPMDEAK